MSSKVSVGVLISQGGLSKVSQGRGGLRLEYLIRANQEANTELFFFSLDNVNFLTQGITGIYKADRGWKRGHFPYPQSLYRRCTISDENEQDFTKLIKQLRLRKTVFINYQFPVDKWEMHCCLTQKKELSEYLLPTWQIEGRSQLAHLMDSFPVLYLKACKGGRGKQVMRVENLGRGGFRWTRFVGGLTRGRGGRESVIQAANDFFGSRQFIAQKGIDLLSIRGCSVDFRGEMQRCGQGAPRIIAIPVRMAREGSPITTHSVSMSLEEFSSLHPDILMNSNFTPRAHDFLQKVYTGIESCFGSCGELGIDFAMDRNGRLWFIEANAQSAKVSFFNSYPESLAIQSFAGLLEYAKARVKAMAAEKT